MNRILASTTALHSFCPSLLGIYNKAAACSPCSTSSPQAAQLQMPGENYCPLCMLIKKLRLWLQQIFASVTRCSVKKKKKKVSQVHTVFTDRFSFSNFAWAAYGSVKSHSFLSILALTIIVQILTFQTIQPPQKFVLMRKCARVLYYFAWEQEGEKKRWRSRQGSNWKKNSSGCAGWAGWAPAGLKPTRIWKVLFSSEGGNGHSCQFAPQALCSGTRLDGSTIDWTGLASLKTSLWTERV